MVRGPLVTVIVAGPVAVYPIPPWVKVVASEQ